MQSPLFDASVTVSDTQSLSPTPVALQVVYSNFDALQATLTELEALISQHMDSGDWETAAALWNWKDPDRELFLKQVAG